MLSFSSSEGIFMSLLKKISALSKFLKDNTLICDKYLKKTCDKYLKNTDGLVISWMEPLRIHTSLHK